MTRKKQQKKGAFVYKSPQSKIDTATYLSSLVNPFDPQAKGSKIHDANASATFCYQSRQVDVRSSNANGAVGFQVFPFLQTNVRHCNSTGTDLNANGSIVASPSLVDTDVPEYSELVSNGNQFRIVSWGLRITCDASAHLAQGRLYIMEQSGNVMNGGADLTKLSDNYMLLPVTHDMDYTIIPNHVNDTYQEFVDVNLTYGTYRSASEQAFPWRSILVLGLGLDVNTSFNVEIVYNLEIIPQIGTLGSRLSTPAAPHSNEVLERVHNTRLKLPVAHPSKSLWSKVKTFARDSLMAVGDYALDRLTGGVSHYIENAAKNIARPSQLFLTNG